ncbi:hypothetical protein D3C86_1059990 [compost metagenome]
MAVPLKDHWQPLATSEVKTATSPSQIIAVPVIAGLSGTALTVNVISLDTGLMQPLLFVTTTVYLPATFAS